MTRIRLFISITFLFMFSVWSVHAQGECAFDISSVINRVTEECADIAENEVCYGNRDVNATPRINTIDFVFENPGDRADLYNIQSLVVDAVNTTADTWGVAQMRLQIGSETGLQDVNLLLFGRFDIENAVPDTDDVELQVRSFQKILHREPNADAETLHTVQAGALLTGVGRLEDSTWLRVEDPVTRVVGWVENVGINLVDESRSLGLLPVQEGSSPYYGAMQAFYFENGTSDIGCDSLESDGLIIQTPEGEARISLLINEVSIELTGGERVDEEDEGGGTAFVQANPQSADGMSVNVVNGSATVETAEGMQTVESGQQSTIPISVDLRPSGEPREPVEVELSNINIQPFLPTVRNPFVGNNTNNNNSGSGDGGSVTIDIPNNNNSGSSGNGSGDGNTTGVNVVGNTTGDSSGNGSGTNTGNSSSTGSSTGNTTVDTSNPFETNPDLPSSVDEATGVVQPPPVEEEPIEFITQGNIIALSIAMISAVILIFFIVSNTRRNK